MARCKSLRLAAVAGATIAITVMSLGPASANTRSGVQPTTGGATASSAWSVAQSTDDASGDPDQLNAVTCTSASFCAAVGQSFPDAFPEGSLSRALIEFWNGSHWTVSTSADPGGPSVILDGISCFTPEDCTAVGNYQNPGADDVVTALIEYWNGTDWTVKSPNLTSTNEAHLYGVSCTASDACTAVGDYFYPRSDPNDPDGSQSLIETWNGTTWSPIASPNASGAAEDTLSAISCSDPADCAAVGSATYPGSGGNPTLTGALAESSSGGSWSVDTVPGLGGDLQQDLLSISCTSSTTCTAVGQAQDAESNTVPFAETLNDTNWSITPTPNPANPSELQSVGCTSATECTAVGIQGNNPPQTLIESWNGSYWWEVPSPNQIGQSNPNSLFGDWCVTSKRCIAVGDYQGQTINPQILVESGPVDALGFATTALPGAVAKSGYKCKLVAGGGSPPLHICCRQRKATEGTNTQ